MGSIAAQQSRILPFHEKHVEASPEPCVQDATRGSWQDLIHSAPLEKIKLRKGRVKLRRVKLQRVK